MFDLNGDGTVDASEFGLVTDLMRSHSATLLHCYIATVPKRVPILGNGSLQGLFFTFGSLFIILGLYYQCFGYNSPKEYLKSSFALGNGLHIYRHW